MTGRRKPPPTAPSDQPPPAVIARAITANLRAALREFEAVTKALERPATTTAPPDGKQLAINL